jgi:SSS family solute:Na+ symporter
MVKSEKGFFLADRSIGWLTLTATITATTVGGSATIVAGGRIYAQGLPALWYDIGGGLGLIILGLFLANKVRKTGLITLPDITGSFFGNNVRIGSAILIIITEIAWVSLLIQASGLILSVVINVDYTLILFIITIGFILYTVIGGQYAVIYTDFIQFFIMIIGICFIAAPLLLWEALPNLNQLSSISLAFPVNQEIGILTAGSIFFMMFMPHIVGPDIYSKLLSAKDEKTAKKGAILSGIFKLIFAIGIAIIALSALILHPDLSNPYIAIPTAVFNLSPIVSGIILAGFLSVMISSADSCLLSAGTILSVDIFKKNNINISRFGILFVGFGAFILAVFLGDILKTLQLAYTVFTAGLTLPIIFGFYRHKTRVTSRGAFWSLLIGGSVSISLLYFSSFGDYAVLVGLVFSLIPLLIFRDGEK